MILVSRAERDDERFLTPASRWVEHWAGQPDARWELRAVTPAGHGHFSAASRAVAERCSGCGERKRLR